MAGVIALSGVTIEEGTIIWVEIVVIAFILLSTLAVGMPAKIS